MCVCWELNIECVRCARQMLCHGAPTAPTAAFSNSDCATEKVGILPLQKWAFLGAVPGQISLAHWRNEKEGATGFYLPHPFCRGWCNRSLSVALKSRLGLTGGPHPGPLG